MFTTLFKSAARIQELRDGRAGRLLEGFADELYQIRYARKPPVSGGLQLFRPFRKIWDLNGLSRMDSWNRFYILFGRSSPFFSMR